MSDENTSKRGQFITFEGGEGAGKTTQAKMLCHALEGAGVTTILTREPGGTKGAEAIRDLVLSGASDRWSGMTELLLMSGSLATVSLILAWLIKVMRAG